jgi:hypothetical protein
LSGNAFFDSSRFIGFSPFVNFVLEFDHSGVTYHVRITSITGNTIHFDSVGIAPAAGDTWRIKEPFEIFRYEGCSVRLEAPDGTVYTSTITANDDDHLFFEAIAVPVGDGWKFKINDIPVGSVMHRVSGSWIPTNEQTEPTWVVKYGRQRKLDIVTRDLLNQIRDGILLLRAFQVDAYNWTANGENNQWTPGSNINDDLYLSSWDDAKSQAEREWTQTTHIPGQTVVAHGIVANGSPPQASYNGSFQCVDTEDGLVDRFTAGIQRRYAYAQISGLATCQSHSVDWYCYTTIDSADSEPSSGPDQKRAFDNEGDDDGGALQWRKWVKWCTSAAATASSFRSEALGNTTPSTLPTACVSPNYDHTDGYTSGSYRGYFVKDARAIIRFTFGE